MARRASPRAAGAGTFARVQDDQAKRSFTAEHDPEILAGHQAGPALSVLERQGAILSLFIETAVPDEVEDVVLVQSERSLQAGK